MRAVPSVSAGGRAPGEHTECLVLSLRVWAMILPHFKPVEDRVTLWFYRMPSGMGVCDGNLQR